MKVGLKCGTFKEHLPSSHHLTRAYVFTDLYSSSFIYKIVQTSVHFSFGMFPPPQKEPINTFCQSWLPISQPQASTNLLSVPISSLQFSHSVVSDRFALFGYFT